MHSDVYLTVSNDTLQYNTPRIGIDSAVTGIDTTTHDQRTHPVPVTNSKSQPKNISTVLQVQKKFPSEYYRHSGIISQSSLEPLMNV